MDEMPEEHELRPPDPADRRADKTDEHRVWNYAAQLTAGMLANPARGHFTIKDTVSLFDEILHEMSAYARVRGQLPGSGDEAAAAADKENFRAERPLVRRQVPLPGAPAPEPVAPAPPGSPAYGADGAGHANVPRQPAPATLHYPGTPSVYPAGAPMPSSQPQPPQYSPPSPGTPGPA